MQEGNARRALAEIDNHDVMRAYRRWAPVYDATFGKVVEAGVRQATSIINRYHGRVLEVGVGTGLSLPHYKHSLKVTGVDLSPDMLMRARERTRKRNLRHVEALVEMDATELKFADDSFDVSTAMFVMTVVPDPAQVMNELIRVTKPGGYVVIVNHFSIDKGLRAVVEKRLARFSDILGWRPDFPVDTLMVSGRLKLEDRRPLKPFGFFTLLRFQRLT
jgi:phosphatidylethanolamine/phosphatidyl-N-methylethanolamine N-methyltransferase